MNPHTTKKVFKQIETICVLPHGKNREFRFSVVEVDGRRGGDMRFFEKGRKEDIMLPTKRGIPFPENPKAFLEGFDLLKNKLQGDKA